MNEHIFDLLKQYNKTGAVKRSTLRKVLGNQAGSSDFWETSMTIEEAAASLMQHLGDPEVFTVNVRNGTLVVDVNFVYRTEDVTKLGGNWNGFPVTTGRRSCW